MRKTFKKLKQLCLCLAFIAVAGWLLLLSYRGVKHVRAGQLMQQAQAEKAAGNTQAAWAKAHSAGTLKPGALAPLRLLASLAQGPQRLSVLQQIHALPHAQVQDSVAYAEALVAAGQWEGALALLEGIPLENHTPPLRRLYLAEGFTLPASEGAANTLPNILPKAEVLWYKGNIAGAAATAGFESLEFFEAELDVSQPAHQAFMHTLYGRLAQRPALQPYVLAKRMALFQLQGNMRALEETASRIATKKAFENLQANYPGIFKYVCGHKLLLGQHSSALAPVLERALVQQPRSPALRLLLAQAYTHLGFAAAAAELLAPLKGANIQHLKNPLKDIALRQGLGGA